MKPKCSLPTLYKTVRVRVMLVSGQLIETCLLAPSGVETGTPSGSLNSLAGLIPISLPPVYHTVFLCHAVKSWQLVVCLYFAYTRGFWQVGNFKFQKVISGICQITFVRI